MNFTHELALGKVAVQGSLTQEQLVALVIFHQTSIGHPSFEELLLEFPLSATTLVFHLHKLDLRLCKFEAKRLNQLIFLQEQLGIVSGRAAFELRRGRKLSIDFWGRSVTEARCMDVSKRWGKGESGGGDGTYKNATHSYHSQR